MDGRNPKRALGSTNARSIAQRRMRTLADDDSRTTTGDEKRRTFCAKALEVNWHRFAPNALARVGANIARATTIGVVRRAVARADDTSADGTSDEPSRVPPIDLHARPACVVRSRVMNRHEPSDARLGGGKGWSVLNVVNERARAAAAKRSAKSSEGKGMDELMRERWATN